MLDLTGLLFSLVVPIIISIIVMTAYGYLRALVSRLLGDKSGEVKRRLTLDPREQLDPVGIIMMFIVHVGFIKPMGNSVMYFKNRKRDLALVAILPGFILTIASIIIYYISWFLGFGIYYTKELVVYSTMLWVYNLIPIYPLDGEKLISAFGTPNLKMKMSEYGNILTMILILLTFMGFATGLVYFVSNIILSILT